MQGEQCQVHGHVSIVHDHTKLHRDVHCTLLCDTAPLQVANERAVDLQGENDVPSLPLPALTRTLKLSSCCLELQLRSLAPSLWLNEPAAVQLGGHIQQFARGADQSNRGRHGR
jgi:hypothetical protein